MKLSGRSRRYQKYDSMNSDELDDLLDRHASGALDKEMDTGELLYVLKLYEQKRPRGPEEKTPEEAWEAFQAYYQENDENLEELAYQERPSWVRISLRAAVSLAAVVALFFCVTVTASAFGLNLFGFTPWWDQEQFIIQPEDNKNPINEPISSDSIPYVDLEMILADYGIMANLTPQWIPEGYQFHSVEDTSNEVQQVYTAHHVRGEEMLTLFIESGYLHGNPVYEKDSNPVILYTTDGIDYYIFTNNNILMAIGMKDSFTIGIYGTITLDEMKQMLDSIEPLQ